MLVNRTKKLLAQFTSVGSYLIIFPSANRVDPDQEELPDLGLQFAKASKGVSMR